MPTPVKYSSPGLRDAYKALEAESVDSMTRLLPPELAEEVSPFITGSLLTAGISASALVALSRIMSLLSFALMLVRGLYGKWLYRRSAAARIRRIRAEFPDPEQRRAVLNAQGGVSIAACIGAFILLMIVGSLCSMLLGPDLNALVGTFI